MKISDCLLTYTKTPIIFKWVIWGGYALALFYLGFHHEHWLDEWHVWFMCRDLSFSQLLDAMTGEGHFCFWHMLILPFARLNCGFWCLDLVSCSLGVVAAWLLLFKAPFSSISKILLLVSYPLLYSFPVSPRCYSLVPAIVFIIATFYRQLPNHKYIYCFTVGLLAHTHAYMEGFVGALFLLYCYEFIYLPQKNGNPWKQNIAPAFVTLFMVLLAFLQVAGSLNYKQQNLGDTTDSNVDAIQKLFLDYSILPNQVLNLKSFLNLDLVITLLVWVILLGALFKCVGEIRTSRRFAIIGYLSISYILFFSTNIFYLLHQRLFLPFIIMVALLWMNENQKVRRYTSMAIACLVVLTSFNRYYIAFRDATGLYSNGEDVVQFIHENIPQGSIIAMNNRYKFISEPIGVNYQHYILGNGDIIITDDEIDSFFEEHEECQIFYPMYLGYFEPEHPIYEGKKYNLACLFDAEDSHGLFYHFSLYQIERRGEERCE